MRIVTISDQVDLPTGLGVQHRVLAEALHEAGLGEVISLGFWGTEPLSRDKAGFQTLGIGDAAINGLAKQWGALNSMLKPDVVVSWGDLRLFHGLVATTGDGTFRRWEKQGRFTWLHWYCLDTATFEFTYKGMMQQCDKLVLPTLFGLHVVRAYLPNQPVAVIPCSVDHEVYHPVTAEKKAELREEWGRALGMELTGRRVLLYVDTNQERKATYVAVRCMKELPKDVVLMMHCSAKPRAGSNGWNLPALAKYYGVADRIVWTSDGNGRARLPREVVASMYQMADLRISPTESEGFGVPIIEAAACGISSVVTRVTTTPELLCEQEQCLARVAHWGVQQEGNLERAKVDEADFTAKIIWHLDHPNESKALAATVRERVLNNFTVPKVKAAWADCVAKMIGG